MKKIIYVGEHPAEYGGITRKSKLLYEQLNKYYNIIYININVKKHKMVSFFVSTLKFLVASVVCKNIVYCVDSYRMFALIKIQKKLFPKSLNKTIVVFSGGDNSRFENPKNEVAVNVIKCAKAVWVESFQLKDLLENMGFENVVFYPNPRCIDVKMPPNEFKKGQTLKLLYYSLISRDKGAQIVIDTIKKLNVMNCVDFNVDFYGRIDDDIKNEFDEFVNNTHNVKYCGFNNNMDINKYYSVLNGYDIFMFPTQWKGEGVAGVVVEAKAAGIAIIATKHNINHELILEEQKEGLLIDSGNSDQLAEKITELFNNPSFLNQIKSASYSSRLRYDINEYTELFKHCFD